MKNEFLEKLKAEAVTSAQAQDCKVLDVTFNSEKEGRILRVIIDGADTSLDVCALVSRGISDWLDANEDIIPYENYTFEVSSPGLLRPIKSKADFERMMGKLIFIETKIKAPDGRKRYKGRVKSVTNNNVLIYVEEENSNFEISLDNISKSRIEYEF